MKEGIRDVFEVSQGFPYPESTNLGVIFEFEFIMLITFNLNAKGCIMA